MTTADLPLLPYGGEDDPNSGFAAGVATSEERARRDDADGTTTKRQAEVLRLLGRAVYRGEFETLIGGADGITWKELAEIEGWHHGQASGVLSVLHKDNRIARLTERRNRCFVYVLPEHVNGRDTQAQGRLRPIQPAGEPTGDTAAVTRVRALHGDVRFPDGDVWCKECEEPQPCRTMQAVLGQEITGRSK